MSFFHLLAQAAVAATPEAAAQQGVIAYPPAFFDSFRPANAMEMVQRVPGFTFDGGDDVRGFEGAAGNVLIDGQRPSSKSDNLESILRRLPASQVARIELIRGSAPGIDMQGKTVLVNLVRKDGGGFRGLVAFATNHVIDDGRTAPQLRIEGSGGRDGRSWELSLLSARYFDDGSGDGPGIRVAPNGDVLIRSFIETEGNGGETTLTGAFETPFAGGNLRLNGLIGLDEFDYDEQNRRSFPDATEERDQLGDDEKQVEVGARFNRGFGERTSLELVALQRYEDGHFGETFQKPGSTTFFSLDTEIGESIGRGVLKHRYSTSLSFEAGAEGAFNFLESKTDFAVNGAPQSLPAANVRVEEKRGEVFAKATWRPASQWTLEGGLRQEGSKISSSGDVDLGKTLYFTKPRIAATWAPSATTQLRARLEREVGQLDFEDFVADTDFNTGSGVQAGNPDLDPEQAWVAEVTLEQRFWGAGALVLTYRHFELKDAIDRAPVTAPNGDVFDAPANIGDGTKDEVAVTLTLPLQKLGWTGAQLRGQATWRDSEVTDPTTGEAREISALRPLSWEAHFTHDLPQYQLNWGIDVFGGWRESYYRFDRVQDRKLKTWVSVFAEWKPKPDIHIRAELANIGERGLRDTFTVYNGPRDVAPLRFVDDRDRQFGRMLFLRVRKTFGS
ncbi:MAG: TonB-dependent receptor plug domain-containing protein [Pseudomonadota bacterium]